MLAYRLIFRSVSLSVNLVPRAFVYQLIGRSVGRSAGQSARLVGRLVDRSVGRLINNYWTRLSKISRSELFNRGQCYLPKPKAEADNIDRGLSNSGYPAYA